MFWSNRVARIDEMLRSATRGLESNKQGTTARHGTHIKAMWRQKEASRNLRREEIRHMDFGNADVII